MLRLKFKDENGEEQSVQVDRDVFTVGRHSACDLTYTDSRLSREHLKLERDGSRYFASDAGSSNGTSLNGRKLTSPAEVFENDVLDLGRGLEIKIEMTVDETAASNSASSVDSDGLDPVPEPVPPSPPAATAEVASPGGIPTAFFIIAPLLAVVVLGIVVVAVMFLGGGENRTAHNDYDIENTSDIDDRDTPTDDPDKPTPKPQGSSTPGSSSTPQTGDPESTPASNGTDKPSGDTNTGATAKVEQNSAVFIRQIAQNDPRAFLTGEQAGKVNTKITQLGRSSSLAENLNSARKNASAIKSLAASKNLKPQFLAIAAVTKLGSSRGDVLAAAQSVAGVYDQLLIHIGNENFDDALLMVAAFDQGSAGESMKMRNMLQDLATKSPEGTRTIRSIWFLEKAGKITPGEYDRALTFLAIGTIAQNPKEFGVNAEALKL